MKKTLVKCDGCGEVEFYVMRKADYFTGYLCFDCCKSDFEDYISSVGVSGCGLVSIEEFAPRNWKYYDHRIHKNGIETKRAE